MRLRLIALISSGLVLGACVAPADSAERCAALNAQIEECLGDGYRPVSCLGISETDIEVITSVLDAGGCEVLGGAIPIDGDLGSSYCRLLDQGCVEPTNPAPTLSPARYPVLLVNGIDVSPAFRYSDRLVRTMREIGGHDVHLAIVPPYETSRVRAPVLWERIEEIRAETGAEKVNLVCHSLGGLDCRYLVSPGGLHWEVEASHDEIVAAVASVTTVSTAHRGTRAADAALGFLPDSDRAEAINALATLLGETFTELNLAEDAHLRDSIATLSEAQAPAFNAEIIDAEGVYYQSWGGFSRPYGDAPDGYDARLAEVCATDTDEPGLRLFGGTHDYMATPLIASSEIVSGERLPDADVGEPNDGLCSVRSARWGRFRGCVPADHMEQLGQANLPDANVRTGVDIAWFYANIAADLSREGF